MDLAKLDVKGAAEKGAALTLKNPFTGEELTDNGKPVQVIIAGRDAPSVQSALKDANSACTAGEISEEERGIRVMCAMVKGWSKALGFDGKALEYTPENVRRLLTDDRTSWIAEQIGPFSLARKNYAPKTRGS